MTSVRMNDKEFIWNPGNTIIGENDNGGNCNYAIVILNAYIKCQPAFLLPLWTKATFRMTVDGGTNRWFKWLQENKINIKSIPYPHLVTGDMDSIDVKFLELIRDQGTSSVIVTDDQNETDFTKALKEMKKFTERANIKIDYIIAVVDTSGRLDQIMANINTLFKSRSLYPHVDIFQLSNSSISWLLGKGKHKIHIPQVLRDNREWCALIPIGEQCDHISTTGLKWNLKNKTMKFGDLVSTSNTYSDDPYITVETDKTLLWSMGLSGITYICDDDDK